MGRSPGRQEQMERRDPRQFTRKADRLRFMFVAQEVLSQRGRGEGHDPVPPTKTPFFGTSSFSGSRPGGGAMLKNVKVRAKVHKNDLTRRGDVSR